MMKAFSRKPHWLKTPLPQGNGFAELEQKLKKNSLATVCQEALCPNKSECWSARTATIMILGDTCTRACKFCHVKTGNPKGLINPQEIEDTLKMIEIMSLKYVVITSVDRDDLPDFGANHFAAVVKAVHYHFPETKVEVLIPDFNVDEFAMDTLASSNPFVIGQNLETVRRLTHPVRDPRASYEKTLNALKYYKKKFPSIITKSSLMLGLGETRQELLESFKDLKEAGVDILTIGQYLRPSRRHLSVEKYYHPDEFVELKQLAYQEGFLFVAAGPLVRSSYKAAEFLDFIENRSLSC